MKIARVIVTLDCERDCDGCCNKDLDKYGPVKVKDMTPIIQTEPDIVCITGGEPLLDWDETRRIIQPFYDRKLLSKTPTMYLYTAKIIGSMEEVIHWFNGIHFTLHHPATDKDLEDFLVFQALIFKYEIPKSFRLYIDSRIRRRIPIVPSAWTRAEIKPWMDECPLPKDETLYILE